jgi:conjugal transfer pilus assembly protein TraD
MTPSRMNRLWLMAALIALLLVPAPLAAGALLAATSAVVLGRAVRFAVGRWRPATAPENAIVLGADRAGRRVVLSDAELSAHGLILGASGAGKTTTLLRILTDEIRRGRPVVAIDMKGSPTFALQLEHAATASGRPFQCWSIDGPGHWNPLGHGNATELKDKLIATERFTEPHYQRAAERYVQTVLQVLGRTHPDQPPTLAQVVDLMDPQRLPRMLRTLERTRRDRIQDYLTGLTHDQLSAIRGLQTRLAVLTESHTGAFLSPPPAPSPGAAYPAERPAGGRGTAAMIDLRDALAGPAVVLFSLNSSRYGRLAAQIGTLVVQDLVAASGDRLTRVAAGRGPDRAVIGIDEFSALGADHVIALLARGRESGLSVLVATQELADLDRAAPGLRDQVLGVTAVKIAHRQDVPESARAIAQMAGTETTWEETRQIGSGLLGGYDTGRGTRRQVEQFIVHPNDIKSLRTGEAVVISKIRGERARTTRVAPPQRDGPALG